MSAVDMTQTIQILALNIRLSCQLLGVPESSYYKRINHTLSKTQLRRQEFSLKISQLFKENRAIYGATKIHQLLLKKGEKIGIKLVQKLMKELSLKSHVTKKFKPAHTSGDTIDRQNIVLTEPIEKNKVCSTDITYISTSKGWCYLSTIMDRYTKQIIAWDLDKHMTVKLVQRTLKKAIASQGETSSIILHSNQGSQYISNEYETLLEDHGMVHSFSRKGYPYHNASLESWHGHLKREWTYQFKYRNFEEAYQSIFWYIEAFYNSKRIHQSLGYLTPNQFEKMTA
ncbi:transposase [Lactococcus paracarnosus]|uniref:Transposase n=1 Tax=Pseudolactococcus paracarnosus TaxID=2749962 RepID=A0A7L4WG10_9LACT|nr:transposase [Lactococcus paracarnosus]